MRFNSFLAILSFRCFVRQDDPSDEHDRHNKQMKRRERGDFSSDHQHHHLLKLSTVFYPSLFESQYLLLVALLLTYPSFEEHPLLTVNLSSTTKMKTSSRRELRVEAEEIRRE